MGQIPLTSVWPTNSCATPAWWSRAATSTTPSATAGAKELRVLSLEFPYVMAMRRTSCRPISTWRTTWPRPAFCRHDGGVKCSSVELSHVVEPPV